MMATARLGAAACGLLLAVAGAASAQVAPRNPVTIQFSSDAAAPEQAIVRQLFSDFLRTRPETRVETALVDLNGDRVAEIVVRIRHPNTCAADACHTAALRYDGTRWKVVFERRTRTLATAEIPSRLLTVASGMRELVVDGRERWNFNANGYYPLLESVGEVFQPTEPASAAAAEVARVALADSLGARWATKPEPRSIRFTQAEIDVGAAGGRKAVMVQAEHPMVCGQVIGCPVALLVPDGGGWRAAMIGTSPGLSAVLPSSTGGYRDIAMVDADGYRTFQYDSRARAYRVTATTYSSPVTPAP